MLLFGEFKKLKKYSVVLASIIVLSLGGYSQTALPQDVIIEDGIVYYRVKTLRQLLQIPCMQVRYNNRVIPVALINQANSQSLNFLNGLPPGAYITISLEGICQERHANKCKIIGGGCCKGKKGVTGMDEEMLAAPTDNIEIYYNATYDEILIR
jgi:hypothetical protein